jgi:hypothetical protein
MPQIFPKWSNTVAKVLPLVLLALVTFVVFVFWYWFSPLNLEVGYQPVQPVPFSHKLHVADLGINCFLCHSPAEKSSFAGVPSSGACMKCHEHQANKSSLKLAALMRSANSPADNPVPIPWERVHKIGDYAYFDHSAHVTAGVGCVSCHGQVDQMEVVRQMKPLSMSWCLDCHRNPEPHLRPVTEVTNMNYQPSESEKIMATERALTMDPPTNCSGCHR